MDKQLFKKILQRKFTIENAYASDTQDKQKKNYYLQLKHKDFEWLRINICLATIENRCDLDVYIVDANNDSRKFFSIFKKFSDINKLLNSINDILADIEKIAKTFPRVLITGIVLDQTNNNKHINQIKHNIIQIFDKYQKDDISFLFIKNETHLSDFWEMEVAVLYRHHPTPYKLSIFKGYKSFVFSVNNWLDSEIIFNDLDKVSIESLLNSFMIMLDNIVSFLIEILRIYHIEE